MKASDGRIPVVVIASADSQSSPVGRILGITYVCVAFHANVVLLPGD